MSTATPAQHDLFVEALEQALEHVGDAEWLGTRSALSSPFLLGSLLPARERESPVARGNALRAQLRDAADALDSDQQRLLTISFFERNRNLNINGVALALSMSRAAYYRHRAAALHALASAFMRRLAPAFRSELPAPKPLAGRARELSGSLGVLQTGGTVALIGNSGMGKTALGAAIAQRWHLGAHDSPAPVFWFTLRPPLNDQLASVVFALACFLHAHGGSSAWRQLVVDRGALAPEGILGLLRHDLAQIRAARPLLCFDEVDLLRPEHAEHAQIIQLLDALRPLAPTMLIGQQLLVAPDLYHHLAGLPVDEAGELLARAEVRLDARDLQRLHTATRGNAAMLTLFAALVRSGEPVPDALRQIDASPSLAVLMRRMWLRLNDDERDVLTALSVFRTPAPADAWHDQAQVVRGLIARDLVREDDAGSLVLPVWARERALAQTSADERIALHLHAARLFEMRGDPTPAAWHYIQGRQPALATWLWFNHREQETLRGHAAAALEIFADVTSSDLPDAEDRRALALLRAGWLKLSGAAGPALDQLNQASWPPAHPAAAHVQRLRGSLLEMQGQIGQAVAAFRAGLAAFDAEKPREAVLMRASVGYAHFRQRDMDQALRSALGAQAEAEEFRGFVEMQRGNLDAARMHFDRALELVHEGGGDRGQRASVLGRIGALEWQRGNLEEAMPHLNAAIEAYQAIGNTVAVLYERMNLAAACLVAGQARRALAEAEGALETAAAMQHAYLVAGLSNNAAEACLHLGRLDDAERYAMLSLQQEEEAVRPYALTVLGMAQRARGDHPRAAATLRMAVETAHACQDRFAEAHAWRELAAAEVAGPAADLARAEANRLFSELGLKASTSTST